MTRKPQPKPIEVFEANISDARRLIAFAQALENGRRWTRVERRQAVGDALGIAKKHQRDLACVESADVFVVIKPGSSVLVQHFTEQELRPLLRQAVVAISAAVESYVAEKASSYISQALDSRPDRLKDVLVSLDHVIEIEERYERRRWGHRALLEEHIEREASPAPSQIGIVFSTVGQRDVLKNVDKARGATSGTSARQLQALYDRRNKIAHTGDRTQSGRAALSLGDVEEFFAHAVDVVHAMERVLP